MSEKTTAPKSYIITTHSSQGGVSRTQLWSSTAPLPIGHPFQWVMERTPEGLRVRALSNQRDEVHAADLREITGPVPEVGTEIELPSAIQDGKSVVVRIRPATIMRPAFDAEPIAEKGSLLHVYACIGRWVLESAPIGEHYVAHYQRRPAFTVKAVGEDFFELTGHLEGIAVARTGQTSGLVQDAPVRLSAQELAQTRLTLENRIWRFGAARAQQIPLPVPGTTKDDTETEWYRKTLLATGATLALLLALAVLIPYTPPEEPIDVIPPQVAKLVLQKPQPAAASAPETAAAKAVAEAPKKVQQTAVVQAFRAKALQSAVSNLLKGGMAKLLAQSDFAVGTNASLQARKIFDAKSKALDPTAPDVGYDSSKSLSVASLGGTGAGTGAKGAAGSVGYGKGDHASLKGQGESFVSLDIAAASVEDGLTKDEVGAIIHQHLSEIRYCYESAMIRAPDIEGKLLMSFVIGGNGSVKTSEVKSSTLPDPRLDDCVLRRLVTWRFPQPKGGVEVAVTYPFIFKTLGR